MIIDIILIAAFGFVAETFAAWWSVAVAAFLVGFWRAKSGRQAAAAGAVGVGLLWLIMASSIHFRSSGILTARVAEMLQLPLSSLVLVLTAVIGGAVGALGASVGFHLRVLITRPRSSLSARPEGS